MAIGGLWRGDGGKESLRKLEGDTDWEKYWYCKKTLGNIKSMFPH